MAIQLQFEASMTNSISGEPTMAEAYGLEALLVAMLGQGVSPPEEVSD